MKQKIRDEKPEVKRVERHSLAAYAQCIGRVMLGSIECAQSEDDAHHTVIQIQRACATAAAALALQPIPFADVALLLPLEVRMIQAIGRAQGKSFGSGTFEEMQQTYGFGLLAQTAFLTSCKLVPFLGSIVAASRAYSMTLAISEVADHYMTHGCGVLPRPANASFMESRNLRWSRLRTALLGS